MMEPQDFWVRVRCDTYNQVSFIKDTLDGFSIQETNFPYICTIFDDASTDGEPDVLMNYLQQHFDVEDKSIARKEETEDYVLIFARNKKNKNCFFAVFFLKYNHYSIKKDKFPYSKEWNNTKYTALCEGDDYWIDPCKLQKQVDFLERNPQYSMVRTNVHRFHQDKGYMEKNFFNHSKRIKDTKEFYTMHTLWLATCTWLFRNIYNDLDYSNRSKDVFYGDIYLLLQLSQLGKVKYLEESTAVYRILGESASHFKSWKNWFYFSWRCKNTRLLFALKYPTLFKTRFWFMELLRVGYRAIRTFDMKCIRIAVKSVISDFYVLFIK